MTSRIDVTITIDDAALGDVDDIAEHARAAGMTVTSVLRGLGVITGSVDRTAIPALATIPGVRGVEPDAGIDVPAPDSPIQ
ncbi:hypothetical protein OG921_07285 [Aldersonia sp. NBC_00410]|uniref:hypothetical protein n=1 Tax=Aldersonia sp. NBC_00410 TaxID=2975954 RepID=UPI0022534576|nr:hypothetical protein [Aldersonia sp. NBC_00410]MCX5042969.1 hypothetical protein [Aldersonia sp. NBC_00410]